MGDKDPGRNGGDPKPDGQIVTFEGGRRVGLNARGRPSFQADPVDSRRDSDDLSVVETIQERVLWLAVRMVDHANHERPNPDGVKVGGHQASSASMVTIMTGLWFQFLDRADLVSVKPHASPVFHAIQYLLGRLDRSYLTRLRDLGGLQSYPSRTKDPDEVHFSTGSVGLGAVAPLCASMTRRYIDAHFGQRPPSRFIAVVGDAELDEGNVWEAVGDSALAGLGNVMWIVDLNRQSLDRVVPGIKAHRLERVFEDNGWHVVEAKYGRRLQKAFERPGGRALRRHIDAMPNEQYQSLFAHSGGELRERFLVGADDQVREVLAGYPDDEVAPLVQNLGGHDLTELVAAYRSADAVTDRPSVVFAYTVKGWGLPIAGDPSNHSQLLSTAQIEELRATMRLTPESEWDAFDPASREGQLCAQVADRLRRDPVSPRERLSVPMSTGVLIHRPVSTQETFGRTLAALAADPAVAPRLVTASPDVAVSTNLGGWINKAGVFSHCEEPDYMGERGLLRWRPSPRGHHIELGISEMNLFLLLSQLGLGHELHGETLLPVGTVYDPFVCRGLDAFIYGCYTASRFIIVGTPSGVSLAPEGGAHQSTITASIGLELPNVTFAEPAYAQATDWLLCDGLDRLTAPDGESLYLRLSTRPVDQSPFTAALDRLGEDRLRSAVLAGGYRLIEVERQDHDPLVLLFASGAIMPEVVEAAEQLAEEGVAANVVDVTSIDRLYRGWRLSRQAAVRSASVARDDGFHLASLILPFERSAPIVTIHDASSHAMAWLGSVFGARVVPIGVDVFGQSGSLTDVYRVHDLTAGAITNAALLALAGDPT